MHRFVNTFTHYEERNHWKRACVYLISLLCQSILELFTDIVGLCKSTDLFEQEQCACSPNLKWNERIHLWLLRWITFITSCLRQVRNRFIKRIYLFNTLIHMALAVFDKVSYLSDTSMKAYNTVVPVILHSLLPVPRSHVLAESVVR